MTYSNVLLFYTFVTLTTNLFNMNLQESTTIRKNSLSALSLPFAVAALFIGLSISEYNNHRQYTPEKIKATQADNDKDAAGMMKYFFNARKDPSTNQLDYKAMIASAELSQELKSAKRRHSSSTLPNFNWNSVGPVNVGGRTRSILIDNQDATHQTIFAGGVSGGIWKSTNGGSTWGKSFATISMSQAENMANMNINCIAQDANGVIYVGTGEGFTAYDDDGTPYSSGELGAGIFKSTDDGNTWTQLTSTIPATADSWQIAWAYTNRIGILPNNPNTIYAATNLGVYISRDGGTSWRAAYGSPTKPLWKSGTYNALDLKVSTDGSVIVACIGGYTYLCYPQTNDSLFTQAKSSGVGHINGDASRIEYAISPTDPNRIYASEIAQSGSFCQNKASGIYMTMNAKTNEGYWYLIGPGGSVAFDPYVEPASTDDQATYDNTLGVFQSNEGQLLAGGTTLWGWTQLYATDTVGQWAQISIYASSDPYNLHAIHPDMHTIVFDNNNPETVYIGCDGGIYKSTNMYIDPTQIESSIASIAFGAYNQNYDVTQYYSLCFAPYVNYQTVNYGDTTKLQGLGMGGGTQDNGSPYINGYGNSPNFGTDMSSGDGAGSWVSSINPLIAYFCSDYGYLLREGNLANLSFPTTAYTQTYGKCLGGDIDSMHNAAEAAGGVNFVFPVALYENAYDTLNSDSVLFIAPDSLKVGDTIYPNGINGTYPYILKKAYAYRDTFEVPDRVVSRLAIAFSGPYGVWINGQGASNSTVIWKPIGGALSKPDAFTNTAPPHCLAWSPNGDALFVGVEGGSANLYRFSNLNKVIANSYCSGALWYKGGSQVTQDDTTVVSTNLTFSGISGADILSIDVDPKNGNNVLVTIGGYSGTSVENVWYSTNALGAAPTFKSVQGNLPPMPVYSAILDVLDTAGNSIPGSAMVATEHGVYSTTNINATPVVWQSNNTGMANCLTFVMKQQTLPAWECNNSGTIYLATHGRGLWESTDLHGLELSTPTVKADATRNNLLVYPNPMTTQGNVSFDLPSADNVTITIYDMQGKVVKEIAMGTQAPGTHIVPFQTSQFPAGTYFASLTGTNFRKVSKFVVIK